MSKLNAKKVQSLKEPGMYGDGAGLYLNVATGGTKSWLLRVTIKGQSKRREIGLGSIDTLSLADARTTSQQLRSEAKAGRDPRVKRDHCQITFEEAARELHKDLAPTFRNEKHRAQWLSSLNNHAFPKIGGRSVADIQRQDVLEVLSPIWVDMHPTAKRLKQRLEAVFDHAIGKGSREAPNPVDGALRRALPKGKHKPKHHSALSWQEVPSFMDDLSDRKAIAALCLRFAILTAARSGEARSATWSEFDLDGSTWTIPAARMKAGEEHRVPLSAEAMAILELVKGLDPALPFPSPNSSKSLTGKPLSVNAFRPLFQRMNREGMTAHGFRSSFRDWCAEKAQDRQLAEAALAHKVGGVEGAYFRSDLFERRRSLMDAWGRYATGKSGDVLEFRRA
ncbi:tyrosine-type recombinase/integrase [Sulfitobacter sp.]|uniref:tyrosine-type recombinase/integrase n=1 Tax=Sulfitobacter sp. TaxID=1903071 RepID=UPI003002B946